MSNIWTKVEKSIPYIHNKKYKIGYNVIKSKVSIDMLYSMQKDNYDPYYNYRPHIVNQSPITQLMSYTWWHLENYYNNKGEFETAKYYTEQLCKILKLNNTTVLNKIKQDFLYQNLLTNK